MVETWEKTSISQFNNPSEVCYSKKLQAFRYFWKQPSCKLEKKILEILSREGDKSIILLVIVSEEQVSRLKAFEAK